MKILKTFTVLTLSVALFCTSAYAGTLEETRIDPDTQRVSVSGTLEKAKGARVTVQILYPGVTESDVENVTNENFTEVFSNVFQVTADENGNFTTPQYTLGKISGKYSVRVMRGKSGSVPEMFEDAFLYVSPSFNDDLLEALQDDATEAEQFVKKNTELILGDVSEYMLMSDDEKDATICMTVKERENLSDNKFADVAQFKKAFNLAVMIQRMFSAENLDDADEIFISNLERCSLDTDCTPVLLYRDSLKTEARQNILSQLVADNSISIGEFVNAIGEKSLLSAISSVSNYAHIERILTDNETWMGADFTKYKKLRDKSSVNKAVANASLKSTAELIKLIDIQTSAAKDDSVTRGSKNTGTAVSGGGDGISAGFAPDVVPSASPQVTPHPSDTHADGTNKNEFSDMSGFDWAKKAVSVLYERKIVRGVSDTLFCPQRDITREEFVKLLFTAFYGEPQAATSNFEDVNVGGWFYPYISAAYEKKLVNGVSSKKFGAGESITREDMAVMAYRFANENGLIGESADVAFDDFDSISDYAKQAVSTLAAVGVVKGIGENLFNPSEFSNRAQAAQLIYALISLNGGGENQ